MFKTISVFFLFTLAASLEAQMELSGYFDILNSYDARLGNYGGFDFGQFEVDVAAEAGERAEAEAAIAFDPTTNQFGLGVAFMDFHVAGEEAEHPARGEAPLHTGLLLGRFDVPFGIDYVKIPSNVRELVTPPLLNRKTINSWNSMGLDLYGGGGSWEYNVFLVNGLVGSGPAVGARLARFLSSTLTVGLSAATDLQTSASGASATGLDLKYIRGGTELTGELQLARHILEGEISPLTHGGAYLAVKQELADFADIPAYAALSVTGWQDEKGHAEQSLAAGGGWHLNGSVECRIEYIYEKSVTNVYFNQLSCQVVMAF